MDVRRQIWLYLALVVAGSAVLDVLIVRGGGMNNPQGFALIPALMWTPGLAAMLTKLIATRSLAGLGWWPKRPLNLFVGWLLPIIYGGIPFAIAGLVGAGTFHILGWNELPLPLVMVFGTIASLLTATGEEIGWRGFLVPALAERHGFWAVSMITGGIWLLYHLPLILFAGYAGAGTPLWFSVTCFTALILVFNPLFTALALRSQSFWPTALAHASHNFFIQSVFTQMVVANATTPWLTGEFGWITPLSAAAVVAVYFWITGVPKTAGDRA